MEATTNQIENATVSVAELTKDAANNVKDTLVPQESREFPNLVLLERVSSYSLFGSIKGYYSTVKDSSPLLEATEGKILSATGPVVGKLKDVTAPVVEKYKTQITNFDQIGCRALDTIEETTTKQTQNLLEQPLVKRSQSAFTSGKDLVGRTVETVTANAEVIKRKALNPVSTTLEITDKMVDRVLPEEEEEEEETSNIDADQNKDATTTTEEEEEENTQEEEELSLRGVSSKANDRLKKKALSSLKFLKVRGEEEAERLRLQSVDLIAYAKEYVDTLAHTPAAEKVKTIGAAATEKVVPVVAQVGLSAIPLLKQVTSRLPFPSEENAEAIQEAAEEEEEENAATPTTVSKRITSSILYLFNLSRWERILTSLQSSPLSVLPSFLLPSPAAPSISISTPEDVAQKLEEAVTNAESSSTTEASTSLESQMEWESELKNRTQSVSTLTTDVSDDEDNFEQPEQTAEVEEMEM